LGADRLACSAIARQLKSIERPSLRIKPPRPAPYADKQSKAGFTVPLSDVDRKLLTQCFHKRPFAWESFVDRYLVLIVFVVQQTARRRRLKLNEHDEFDLVSDVFLTLLRDDFAILKRFHGQSSLATYLTVVTRRVVVRKLVRQLRGQARADSPRPLADSGPPFDLDQASPEAIDSVMNILNPREAAVVRMFYLERKSPEQISEATSISLDAIGPILVEARRKMESDNGLNQGA
jgi:RNA polymerase sigma-70 factor (ECF subfamily)